MRTGSSDEAQGDSGRPAIPEPPSWFQRARASSTRQGSSAPLPPAPAAPSPQNWFSEIRVAGSTGRGPAARRARCTPPPLVIAPPVRPAALPDFPELPPRRRSSVGWIVLTALVALPTFFAAGFRARELAARQQRAAAVDVALPAAPEAADEHTGGAENHIAAREKDKPQQDSPGDARAIANHGPNARTPAGAIAASALDSASDIETARRRPRSGSGRDQPGKARGALPVAARGFELRPPGNISFADIRLPRDSWFALASTETTCDSGTCKIASARPLDRKLDTALEWSSSPQEAAKLAEREGKLVFLIQVSGNFAQPGFT